MVSCKNCPGIYCSVCVDKCPKCNFVYTDNETLIQLHNKIRNYGACKKSNGDDSNLMWLLNNFDNNSEASNILFDLRLFNRLFKFAKKIPKKYFDKNPTHQDASELTKKLFQSIKLSLQTNTD